MTTSFSPRTRYSASNGVARRPQVVPPAQTWDGGMPVRSAGARKNVRTLDSRSVDRTPFDVENSAEGKDSMVSLVVGGLFGLALTAGMLLGSQEPSTAQDYSEFPVSEVSAVSMMNFNQ